MTGQSNKFRIIGGHWRGRKLCFPDEPGLRPTPERVRETLFNWLQPFITGSRCLDLFSGSGALAFEAFSRGAHNVTIVDANRDVISVLKKNIELLNIKNACLLQTDATKMCALNNTQGHTFDIVFLDPPYKKNFVSPCCVGLENNNYLAPVSYIYIEAEYTVTDQMLPDTYSVIRNKKAGNVNYHLIKREQ
ncbi:MAG: 16S rRNA (guanine(966)-N(2))-methyltransferase RsmD [Gammaproteobacteria bacterium]|nr:16S rRNA (guanine(966)-N(2))-methyltransferase RsmD [Gammaproteobacteria bacterium]